MGKNTVRFGLTPTGKLLVIILGIAAIVTITTLAYNLIGAKIYYTCKQLRADGYVHIKRGDTKYQAALDRDHDGVACG